MRFGFQSQRVAHAGFPESQWNVGAIIRKSPARSSCFHKPISKLKRSMLLDRWLPALFHPYSEFVHFGPSDEQNIVTAQYAK
jgi:hypothetical protein